MASTVLLWQIATCACNNAILKITLSATLSASGLSKQKAFLQHVTLFSLSHYPLIFLHLTYKWFTPSIVLYKIPLFGISFEKLTGCWLRQLEANFFGKREWKRGESSQLGKIRVWSIAFCDVPNYIAFVVNYIFVPFCYYMHIAIFPTLYIFRLWSQSIRYVLDVKNYVRSH